MSKFVRVPDGNYKIEVEPGGSITLDTGNGFGEVRITGNLTVEGDNTIVESENLTVKDNIIVINEGETGAGITLDEAGIRIERGSFSDVFFVFDEDLTNSILPTSPGLFTLKEPTGRGLVGLQTNHIATGGGDLYLINSGSGVISVSGTTDYELQVTDDDDITNKKYVDDAITTAFATVFLKQIGEGTIDPSSVVVYDSEISATLDPFDPEYRAKSVVEVNVDDTLTAQFFNDRVEINNIRIFDTRIESTNSNQDLILSAPGTGTVSVRDVLEISKQPTLDDPSLEPSVPLNGSRLYIKDRNYGGSGIFAVHEDSTRDEIISNNRSLVYSMLF